MAGKKSDPNKLAADKAAITASLKGFIQNERVQRSQKKAIADRAAFQQTGEGTMGEALNNQVKTTVQGVQAKIAARKARKLPPVLSGEGATVVGTKKNRSPV